MQILINVPRYLYIKVNFRDGMLKAKDFSQNCVMIGKHNMALYKKQRRRPIFASDTFTVEPFQIRHSI